MNNCRRRQQESSVEEARQQQLQLASDRLWNFDTTEDELSLTAYLDQLIPEQFDEVTFAPPETDDDGDDDDSGQESSDNEYSGSSTESDHSSSNTTLDDDEDNDSDRSESEPSSSPDPEEAPFSVPGIYVWVEGDGKVLPEYLDPDEDQQEAGDRRRITRYVECEPNTVAVIKYTIERDFEYWITTGGMALQSRFWLDGKIMQTHVDNFSAMRPKDQDFNDEFAGRSIGRAKGGPRKAGRREVIYEPMMFAPLVLCMSLGHRQGGVELTTARRRRR